MIKLILGIVLLVLVYSLFHGGIKVEINGKEYKAAIKTERENK